MHILRLSGQRIHEATLSPSLPHSLSLPFSYHLAPRTGCLMCLLPTAPTRLPDAQARTGKHKASTGKLLVASKRTWTVYFLYTEKCAQCVCRTPYDSTRWSYRHRHLPAFLRVPNPTLASHEPPTPTHPPASLPLPHSTGVTERYGSSKAPEEQPAIALCLPLTAKKPPAPLPASTTMW